MPATYVLSITCGMADVISFAKRPKTFFQLRVNVVYFLYSIMVIIRVNYFITTSVYIYIYIFFLYVFKTGKYDT
jgi:hypothetical protein